MQKLPSITEFKQKAFELKKSGSYKKLGHSQNALAKTYGFKDYNSIKPYLPKESLMNEKDIFQEYGIKINKEHSSIMTMKELKEDMEESLEYSDPNDLFSFYSSHNLGEGMKPVVGDEFFNTEKEAVEYELKTDEIYKLVKDCNDNIKVVRNYDEDDGLTFYTLSKDAFSK